MSWRQVKGKMKDVVLGGGVLERARYLGLLITSSEWSANFPFGDLVMETT